MPVCSRQQSHRRREVHVIDAQLHVARLQVRVEHRFDAENLRDLIVSALGIATQVQAVFAVLRLQLRHAFDGLRLGSGALVILYRFHLRHALRDHRVARINPQREPQFGDGLRNIPSERQILGFRGVLANEFRPQHSASRDCRHFLRCESRRFVVGGQRLLQTPVGRGFVSSLHGNLGALRIDEDGLRRLRSGGCLRLRKQRCADHHTAKKQ